MSATVSTTMGSVPRGLKQATAALAGFARWLRTHRGAVWMAGLLSFAAPVTFLSGAVSMMREPGAADMLELTAWLVLFGLQLWGALLVIGYVLQRIEARGWSWYAGTLPAACAAAAFAEFSNGRGEILFAQGVVQSEHSMHLYALFFALIMALLFFAHLKRSRAREAAAARLAAAQAAQQRARQRLVEARLQAVQARIDPQLLFEMLDAVRHAYADDPARAERLLDELVAFLRAALPRLRTASSTVLGEARLAKAYVNLRILADAPDAEMSLEVSPEVGDARFPPGVVLPLLADALRARSGAYALVATRDSGDCRLALCLPAPPLDAAVNRVRALLADLYGTSAELAIVHANGVTRAIVKVPYEPA
jgi:hypothetical protein